MTAVLSYHTENSGDIETNYFGHITTYHNIGLYQSVQYIRY